MDTKEDRGPVRRYYVDEQVACEGEGGDWLRYADVAELLRAARAVRSASCASERTEADARLFHALKPFKGEQ